MKTTSLAALLACAFPICAVAQHAEPVSELDNIVVTASRVAQLESEVVGDVSVIDRATLEKAGQSSVAELLSREHGIQISTTGGPQTPTSIFMRGTNSSHVLVLIDGVRINSSVQGGANFNAIDPALIERIEILRGAASSLYGADAIGGVINIITRKGGGDRPAQLWGSIGAGTYGTFKSSMGVQGSSNGWDYSLGGALNNSDGFNSTKPASGMSYNPDKDGYDSHSFNGRLGYEWSSGQRLDLTAYNAYINGDFDAGTDPTYAHAQTRTRQQVYSISSSNKISNYWQSKLSAQLSKETLATAVFSNQYSSLQRQYSWQNDFSLTADQSLSLLAERLEERITHTGTYADTRRNTNSFGLIYRADLGIHHVQASVRNDKISSYGNRTTGSLAYSLDLNQHINAGIAANTGFRAPTFTDMYYVDPWGMSNGNPDLQPEKSRNIEAHIGYQNDGSEIKLVAYQNKIRNLIVARNPALYDYTPINLDKATIRGITLTASQQFENAYLWASADFLNPRNDTPNPASDGNRLPRRAKQQFMLGGQYHINEAIQLGAEYQFTGKRYDNINNADSSRMGGFSLVNLTAEYAFNKQLTGLVRWNNIFNKDYELAKGYNTPGSNIFFNLLWRM
jgi:vitamin B12 transporter